MHLSENLEEFTSVCNGEREAQVKADMERARLNKIELEGTVLNKQKQVTTNIVVFHNLTWCNKYSFDNEVQ